MWTPINCDEIQIKARDSLRAIVSELQAIDTGSMTAFHLCEHALLYAYLGLEEPNDGWQRKSLDYLNLAIERLSVSSPPHNGLYGGVAGIGWLVAHVVTLLSRLNMSDAVEVCDDGEDPLLDVDEFLLRHLEIGNYVDRNYDLISGVVGIGLYWLERLPDRKATIGIQRAVEILELAAEETSTGITWFTPPSLIPPIQKGKAPNGYYNLGVAHGVPGVIAFLAQVASLSLNDVIKLKTSTLLEASIKWLLVQQRPPGSLSRYSSWTTSIKDSGDSRLGWCYGDLGVAAVLHLTALLTGHSIWMSEAESTLDHCVLRTVSTGVFDAPLCHGAFGVAHIYNRIDKMRGDDRYKQATITWVLRGLAMRKRGVGVAGYYAWDSSLAPSEYANASFLSGAIGVALVLLSFISSHDPQWDRMLAISGPHSMCP